MAFISGLLKPKRIFEMGSGYGHSAFWYFIGGGDFIEEVTLTEKRSDMEEVFHALPWPVNWKKRMSFHNEDAFEVLEREQGRFDLILIDGVKADYKAFLQAAFNKLSKGGVVAIDNSFWRGSFLNEASRKKNLSARKIAELHRFIADLEGYETLFLPFKDGLTVLRKKN